MKPIWCIIGVACVLISAIGRMADSLSDVLITLGVIALVVLVIWLFEKWDSLGNEVDAAVAESFVFHFFNYVFMPQPEKVLRYVYENRDNKSLSLTMPLGFYYTYSPQTRKIIDTAIAKLDSPAMRKYYKEMTELWVSYANN